MESKCDKVVFGIYILMRFLDCDIGTKWPQERKCVCVCVSSAPLAMKVCSSDAQTQYDLNYWSDTNTHTVVEHNHILTPRNVRID